MQASLAIKKERYYAVISYVEEGVRKQKWISLDLPMKNNKRKAEEKMREILEAFQAEAAATVESTPQIMFTDYILKWLELKKPHVELSTWEGYQIYAIKHIIPYFQPLKLKLDEVKPMHVKQYYLDKSRSGRMDGKAGGLSVPSLKKHAIVLKSVFDDAVLDELVSKNPVVGVKIPTRSDVVEAQRAFLSAEQANMVLKAFAGHPLEALVYITLYYGLRRSEALGLKWSAIDFENKTMAIRHTVVKNLSIVAKDRTKSETSHHVFHLSDDAIRILKEVKEKQLKMQMYYGDSYFKSDYVFTWEDGKPFRPDYVTRGFQRVLAEHKIPIIRFHDLRHSTASILHDLGWDIKDIQEWLRHSSVETTADIYTHISASRKQQLAENLGSVIKRES